MMKRVRKPAPESGTAFKPQQSQLASRPFAPKAVEPEAPVEESRVSFSLADIDIFPREIVQPKLRLGPVGDRYEQEADRVASRVVQSISSPDPSPVQRQKDLEDEDELDQEEDKALQRKVSGFSPSTGVAGVGPEFESSIHRARSKGMPLSDGIRRPMERAFGTDFGGVRIHVNEEADRLNRSIQARAFTTGQDVFLRRGEYRPGSSEGQRLLAHELTHVVQRTKKTVSRAYLPQSRFSEQDQLEIIQRQFAPATINSNAHLRDESDWRTKVGNRIDAHSEIVVDKAQQKIEGRIIGSDTTWTKAVNVNGEHWDWNIHNGNTTYIRDSKIGADKRYPQRANNRPPRRQSTENPKLNWHHLTGEFTEIEDSVSTVNTKIAYHKGIYERINPATGQVAPLDFEEGLQLDTTALEDHLKDRVRTTLTNATNSMAWQSLFVADDNIWKLMMTGDQNNGGSKSLRWDRFGKELSGKAFVAYYKWVTDPNGPFDRIRKGAVYARNSLEYWRKWLFPPNGTGVTITSLNLSGSDLHESGLGVMFVTFCKATAGGNPDYNNAGNHQMVVKPEERVLEQKLFGTQNDSLANIINTRVGLAGPDQIATYKQKIEAGFGTLCEKVVGTQAKNLPKNQVRPITQALKESLVFVLITGLTDLHGENVLWENGKPYLIDADNALKLKFMTPGTATLQNGYVDYGANDDTLTHVYDSAIGYPTAMMQALRNPGTPGQTRLLRKVKQIFRHSQGRIVPIKTATWGSWMMDYITIPNEGQQADTYNADPQQLTRWGYCDAKAAQVPVGFDGPKGLKGEAGVRGGTDGNFQHNKEKAQIYADFKVGQIPFYNYRYRTGKVLHNGKVIWNGQTIDERMLGLFTLFPQQIY